MKAKMLNQNIQIGKETHSKREKAMNLDKDVYSTSFLTNLPANTESETAKIRIEDFIGRHIGKVDRITLERNCLMGFWGFSVITFESIEELSLEDKL